MYRPSSPRYGRIPESTLTPAPVKSAVRPGRARKEESWSTAATLEILAMGVPETGLCPILGIEIRTMVQALSALSAVTGARLVGLRCRRRLCVPDVNPADSASWPSQAVSHEEAVGVSTITDDDHRRPSTMVDNERLMIAQPGTTRRRN